MTDDEQFAHEIAYRLDQTRKDLATSQKLAELARSLENSIAITPATFAVELSEEAIKCLEAAKAHGTKDDSSLPQLHDAMLAQDSADQNIAEALNALTSAL
jgi:predicted transcriptional regulator